MTHFMRDGNRFSVAPAGALDIHDTLPLGTYKVGFIELTGTYYLERIEDFEVTGKIYGNTITQRDRILRTFHDRSATTGVLLTGEKGSGKTLLAKMTSLKLRESGIPTLVINMAYCGDTFNSFMQAINQPVIVIFDEFEKVYDRDDQQRLLTLLDGTYSSKKLFILTANNVHRVDDHMMNRPGRLFYSIEFAGLDVAFVRDYCQDNLDRKNRIEDVARASRLFTSFNFDILKALVEEMNRFDESVDDALEMLNARPEVGQRHTYIVSLRVNGEAIERSRIRYDGEEWDGNPLRDEISLYYEAKPSEAQKKENQEDYNVNTADEDCTVRVWVDATHLVRIDVDTGDFVFRDNEGIEISLALKQTSSRIDYSMVS